MRWAILMVLSLNTPHAIAQWQPQLSHTTESLRGISMFNQDMVWASGTHGTYLFTIDGGKTWTTRKVPGAESLDFRGVKSFGFDAFLLAAGPGDQSRIYHTRHLGEQWELQFTNREPQGFFDCMAFFDALHGIVLGDPVNGKFQILRTQDGGVTWRYSDPKKMPPAVPGEGAFAASNSCMATQARTNAWFVTGGSASRVFRSSDGGKSWKVSATPITHGDPSSGVFSVAFLNRRHGVTAGGDYRHPENGGLNLATTEDGGKSWKLASVAPQRFFSAVIFLSEEGWMAVAGSSASAFSKDRLRSWEFFSPAGFNALDARPGYGMVFAAGAKGTIATAQLGNCTTPCESTKSEGH